jgi:hypothetical protein
MIEDKNDKHFFGVIVTGIEMLAIFGTTKLIVRGIRMVSKSVILGIVRGLR